jgi:hypothetical protein
VHGVGDQRQRIGRVTEAKLGDHECAVERRADRKCAAEIIGHMAVPGVIMRVGAIVMMCHGVTTIA